MTRARIWAATIFIDYFSRYVFVALTRDQTGESTLDAKKQFEHKAATGDVVVIKHYHADNGRFAEPSFRNDIVESGQRITFCGVGAHHQN